MLARGSPAARAQSTCYGKGTRQDPMAHDTVTDRGLSCEEATHVDGLVQRGFVAARVSGWANRYSPLSARTAAEWVQSRFAHQARGHSAPCERIGWPIGSEALVAEPERLTGRLRQRLKPGPKRSSAGSMVSPERPNGRSPRYRLSRSGASARCEAPVGELEVILTR